jgi:hypothetical protein
MYSHKILLLSLSIFLPYLACLDLTLMKGIRARFFWCENHPERWFLQRKNEHHSRT